ncbi:hypothetical protein CDEST_15438 [Colletotrichum destructivum]|uniref:LysM domain-containing protein n=1 Tax=Colletotrichum destructivum TaxID=34406 RepID=A0AAX4J4W9_9PEZI|nr:hypothetical protein CDEST_15438 [Colletotrichum destructivum]
MWFIFVFVFATFHRHVVASCDAEDAALWRPNQGDTFDKVLRPLGIDARQFMEHNEDVTDVNKIDYVSIYCIPYITSLSGYYYTTSGHRFLSPSSQPATKPLTTNAQPQTSITTEEQTTVLSQTIGNSQVTKYTSQSASTTVEHMVDSAATEASITTPRSTHSAAAYVSERRCTLQRDRNSNIAGEFQKQARAFCDEYGASNFYPGQIGTGNKEKKVGDEQFVFSIDWIDQCDIWPVQNGLQPTVFDRTITCLSVMTQNFLKCGNKRSNGGYVDVSCLRYSSRAKDWALDGG